MYHGFKKEGVIGFYMKKHLSIIVYFTLMLFLMYESVSYFLTVSKTSFEALQEYLVYGVCHLASAAGILLFIALKKHRPKHIQVFVVLAFALAAVALCCAGLFRSVGIFWGMLVLFNLMQGVNIAVCANYLYQLMRSGIKAGTTLASAAVAGLILNYAVDLAFPAQAIHRMVFLAAAILLMLYLAFRKISLTELFGVRETGDADADKDRKRFLPVFYTLAMAIVIMAYMVGVNDMVIFPTLLAGPAQSLFIPQALLYIPGLFIAGLLADIKEGKYLPIATLACTLLITPAVTQLNSPEVFTSYSGITYFLGGFYLIFAMTSIVALARRSRDPVVIISTGAGLYFVFLGVGAFTSSLYFQADNVIALTVFIGLAATLLVIFYLSGSLHPRAPAAVTDALPGLSAETIESRISSYRLTRRESEALRHLLDGQSTASIAEKMVVTEKTVQKYIGSMMAKCGTKSRSELITKFTKQTG